MDDSELVKEFRKGDKEAFSELVRRYSKPLTMMIIKIVRDKEDARDISQNVFLKAFEGLPRFMMASSFKTWLYRIAINAATDHMRRRKPSLEADPAEQLADQADSPAVSLEKAQFQKNLRAVMDGLPEKQRRTLQLRVYEGMDYDEIAHILGGSEGSARGNFFQAVKKLREALGKDHENIRLPQD
jgi:RNA polymerase sigma-70 factor (ECF subfamily)